MNAHALRRLPLALAISMLACKFGSLSPTPQPTRSPLSLPPAWMPTRAAATSTAAERQATVPGPVASETSAQSTPTQTNEWSIPVTPLEDLRNAGGEPLPAHSSPIAPDNAARLELLATWGRGTVEKVVHSPDGSLLAVASSRGVYLYDARTLADVRFIPIELWTSGVAFSPDGRFLAALTENTTDLYRVEDGSLVWRNVLGRHGLRPRGAASCSPQSVEGYGRRGDVAISPDGRIVAAGLGAIVYLWDLEQGALLDRIAVDTTTVSIDQGFELAIGIQQIQFAMNGNVLLVAHVAPYEHDDAPAAVDFFALPSGELLWAESDTGIVWDDADGLEAQPMAISSDGGQLLYFNRDPEQIEFLDIDLGYRNRFPARSLGLEQLKRVASSLSIASLAISPSGNLLALGNSHNSLESDVSRDAIFVVDSTDGSLVRALDGHYGPVTTLSFSPDGKTLASGSLDNTVRLWRIFDGAQLAARHDHSDEIFDVSFSPDGGLLAAAMKDRRARVWQVSDGALRYKLGATPAYGYWREGHIPGMYALDFSPDGSLLATGSDIDAGLAEWDLTTGNPRRQIYAGYRGDHTFSLVSLSAGYGILVERGEVGPYSSSSLDFIEGDQRLMVFPVSFTPVVDAYAVSDSGTELAVVSFRVAEEAYDLVIYELVGEALVERLRLYVEGRAPDMLTFSPDGALLAQVFNSDLSDDTGPAVKVIRLADSKEVASFIVSPRSSDSVYGLEFSPGGRLLAVALADGQIQLWGSANGTQLAKLKAPLSSGIDCAYPQVNSRLSFSPDGRLLVLGRGDGGVQLWGVPR